MKHVCEVHKLDNKLFTCPCGFHGDLAQAVEHAVKNQYKVEGLPNDKRGN